MPSLQTYAIRLVPGDDLKQSIQAFVVQQQIEAGWIASCAGSLTQYHIRFANQSKGSQNAGHFEIVSLAGTLSMHGSHLHISVSDSSGQTIGGHLLDDCKIYTTAEIIIHATNALRFTRQFDELTQSKELKIEAQ